MAAIARPGNASVHHLFGLEEFRVYPSEFDGNFLFFLKKGRTGCGVGGASLGAVSNFMPRWSCGANLRVVVPQSPSSLSVKRSTPNSPQRAALHFPACPLLNLISINQEFPINTQKMGIRKIRHPCCLPYRSDFNFLGWILVVISQIAITWGS